MVHLGILAYFSTFVEAASEVSLNGPSALDFPDKMK
jgi:hypothetical protein